MVGLGELMSPSEIVAKLCKYFEARLAFAMDLLIVTYDRAKVVINSVVELYYQFFKNS